MDICQSAQSRGGVERTHPNSFTFWHSPQSTCAPTISLVGSRKQSCHRFPRNGIKPKLTDWWCSGEAESTRITAGLRELYVVSQLIEAESDLESGYAESGTTIPHWTISVEQHFVVLRTACTRRPCPSRHEFFLFVLSSVDMAAGF